jgi:hypothetical protein
LLHPLTGIYEYRAGLMIGRIVSAKKWSAEKVLQALIQY